MEIRIMEILPSFFSI